MCLWKEGLDREGTQGVNSQEVDGQGRGTHAISPWMFL